jgi:hypothetical protein
MVKEVIEGKKGLFGEITFPSSIDSLIKKLKDYEDKNFYTRIILVTNILASPDMPHNKLSDYTWRLLVNNIRHADPFLPQQKREQLSWEQKSLEVRRDLFDRVKRDYETVRVRLYKNWGISNPELIQLLPNDGKNL